MTTTFDIDEIERLLAAATPGEWEVDSERSEDCSPKHHDYFIGAAGSDGKWVTLFDSVNSDQKLIEEEYDEDYHHAWDVVGKSNAALIVTLHNSAPAMIAELRELRAENARLREVVKHYGDTLCEGIGECVGDFCGNLSSDECGGCFARAALGEPQ